MTLIFIVFCIPLLWHHMWEFAMSTLGFGVKDIPSPIAQGCPIGYLSLSVDHVQAVLTWRQLMPAVVAGTATLFVATGAC